MNNNDILRRTRYILDLKDNQITKIFKHVEVTATEKQVNLWLKREDEPEFEALSDDMLVDFLDALIIEKRGRKDDAPKVREKSTLDNNLILMKLKIAFHLKAEEALDIMGLAGFKISKHEFSALFRKKDHKHYRACKNQMLRKFMKGLQVKYRGQPKANNQQKTVIKDEESRSKTGKLKLNKTVHNTNNSQKDSNSSEDKTHTDSSNKTTSKAANVWKIPKKKPIN